MKYVPVLDHTKAHQRFFEELTQIPHVSYHEEKLGDYLEQFARERNLFCRRDEIGNVIIRKPAYPGYEDHAPLALQAHMDMVWEKESDSDHDFEHEPLKLYIEDGILRAKGTTLGADDGLGVAYILAILDDATAKHPPLEGIFTVQEEVGLGGALALKPEQIRSRRLVSLDCGGGDSCYISSLGGCSGKLTRALDTERATGMAYEVRISGLIGGYSSGYIQEQANANHMMARVLYQMMKHCDARLVEIQGGKDPNKIATDCRAVFTSTSDDTKIEIQFTYMATEFRREYGFVEKDMQITLKKTDAAQQLCKADSDAVIKMMYLLPCGFRHRHGKFPEIMSEAANWTCVHMEGDKIELVYSLRGSLDSMIEHIHNEMDVLCEQFSFTDTVGFQFPAWEYRESELQEKQKEAFRKIRGKELELMPVQGGLECGVFDHMFSDIEIVTMGALAEDVHTPKEWLNLQSFDDMYQVLRLLAESL